MNRSEDIELGDWLRSAGIEFAPDGVVARAIRSNPASVDGSFRLLLSGDETTAALRIEPPIGRGRRVRRESVEAEIVRRGWRGALDEIALARALAYAPPPEGESGWTILRGAAPRPGEDARFEPSGAKTGRIGRWIPATDGAPGRSLLGREIPAARGRARSLRLGEDLLLDPDGAIRATGCGRVAVEERPEFVAIDLVRNFRVAGDVSATAGEMDEPGDVEISGDVRAGSVVRAHGRIVVHGCVEAARLEAYDGITVAGGIRGAAEIHAGGDVRCAFAEFAKIRAGGDVVAHRAFLHADVGAGGSIVVEDERHGSIVGGHARAGRAIRTAVAGASAETATTLAAGAPPEIETCDAVLREARARIARDRSLLPLAHRSSARIEELLAGEIRRLEVRVRETAARREEILRAAEADPGAAVEIARAAHAGTLLRIGRAALLLRADEAGAKFRLDAEAGEIARRV